MVKRERNSVARTWQGSLGVLVDVSLCSTFKFDRLCHVSADPIAFGHKTFPFPKHKARIYNLECVF